MVSETPSSYHKNRKSHNWLIYDCIDNDLAEAAARSYIMGTLYDLGAGESPYKKFFLQYADKYIAVDWEGSFHSTKADIAADLNNALPISSDVADTVVSLSVMEHLCEPQTMLNEAFRILKPGGMLLLQVPWQWWIHEAPFDYFRYTPYSLRYMHEKAGFVDIIVSPQAGFFTTWFIKFNYFSQRLICGPRFIRWPLRACFMTFWYINQKVAPLLDRLDKDWAAEAPGFFVTARKP